VLSKLVTLALYRAAADARHAACVHGAASPAAAEAHERLLVTIDAFSDDQGGWGWRRIESGEKIKRRSRPTDLRPITSSDATSDSAI
jgi:hypothetical protein